MAYTYDNRITRYFYLNCWRFRADRRIIWIHEASTTDKRKFNAYLHPSSATHIKSVTKSVRLQRTPASYTSYSIESTTHFGDNEHFYILNWFIDLSSLHHKHSFPTPTHPSITHQLVCLPRLRKGELPRHKRLNPLLLHRLRHPPHTLCRRLDNEK